LKFVFCKFKITQKEFMKKRLKKVSSTNNGILSKINDNPEQGKKVSPADKKKGILSELNDDPDQKK
jgi:hypothetical protein